jgi:hypothetical protein
MTGPMSLPKRALHIVRSRASSFKWEYARLSLRSSNSYICLLPCLPVTSIPPCIFPSVTHCRRQFLCKIWPIQFAFQHIVIIFVFLFSSPWRWPQECPQHVSDYCVIKLHSKTQVHFFGSSKNVTHLISAWNMELYQKILYALSCIHSHGWQVITFRVHNNHCIWLKHVVISNCCTYCVYTYM